MDILPTQSEENLKDLGPESGDIENKEQPNKDSDILDLAKLGKFKFEGKEMTFDDLKKSYMLHSDYTKKTQEIAQERKYVENLQADLDYVKANPAMAGKFKEIYPKQYHALLNYVYQDRGESQAKEGAASLPDWVQEKLSKVDKFEEFLSAQEEREFEQSVKEYELKLEKMDAEMSKKYPYAKPVYVYSKVQALMESNDLKAEDVTDKIWDDAWKSVHEDIKGIMSEQQKKNFEGQKKSNQLASDVGPGGGAPGEAPKKLKLSEVADYAIADLKRQQG